MPLVKENELIEKLYRYAEEFEFYFRQKKYYRAKRTYDAALTVACFINLDETNQRKLFGNRETGLRGAFSEDKVQKVFFETSVKGNEEISTEGYEEFLVRHTQLRNIDRNIKK